MIQLWGRLAPAFALVLTAFVGLDLLNHRPLIALLTVPGAASSAWTWQQARERRKRSRALG